jgi:RimJ/RimL family protein N-acetyltransferase
MLQAAYFFSFVLQNSYNLSTAESTERNPAVGITVDLLETDHLIIRPFEHDDLETIHSILNEAFGEASRAERQHWLEWSVMNYTALSRLYQPPYGDRAIIVKSTNTLVGAVGLVPCYGPFDKLPYFRERSSVLPTGLFTPEIGLFWALGASYRGKGYATEAARMLIEFAFTQLRLKRIVAMTDYDNTNSAAVMERLGMTIQRNPDTTPEWFQIVGILEHPTIG